jgi:serine/threonine protein kinase
LLYLNQRPDTARHVVKVIDTFVDSLHLYIFMEYYPKGDMMRMIKNFAPITNLKDVAIIFKKMAIAVQALHDAGVVHRDIKPSNFLIEFDGHEIQVRLCDFGLAQRMPDEDVDILVTGSAGSPVFMSPEVFSQAPFSAISADVWALGVSLHILVFRSIPFGASAESSSDIIAAIQNDAQPNWQSLPQGLQELLSGLFVKDPRSRMTLPQAISHWWLNDASMGYINNLPSIPEVA